MKIILPSFAIGLFLVISQAHPDPSDYQLTIIQPLPKPIQTNCAKSLTTCNLARASIANGYLPDSDPNSQTSCTPHPNCFQPASNCIRNYNCK